MEYGNPCSCLFGRGHITAGRSGRSWIWIWLGSAGREGDSSKGEDDEFHGISFDGG
jgi:hypothetical protein